MGACRAASIAAEVAYSPGRIFIEFKRTMLRPRIVISKARLDHARPSAAYAWVGDERPGCAVPLILPIRALTDSRFEDVARDTCDGRFCRSRRPFDGCSLLRKARARFWSPGSDSA